MKEREIGNWKQEMNTIEDREFQVGLQNFLLFAEVGVPPQSKSMESEERLTEEGEGDGDKGEEELNE
ncbi:hypothetical protein E2542_SST27830 [Spatholobus suberectus]|nr:hypothetical protein E2542_SST27830 [Spatholobus suberectus]